MRVFFSKIFEFLLLLYIKVSVKIRFYYISIYNYYINFLIVITDSKVIIIITLKKIISPVVEKIYCCDVFILSNVRFGCDKLYNIIIIL